MTYLYKCENCNKEHSIDKSMSHTDLIEFCDKCGAVLKRIYQSVSVKTSDGFKG